MGNLLQVGKIAPNFLAVGVYKQRLGKIRLSDYRGKKYVILVFYPGNFTPVSSTELIALSDRIFEFKKLSTQVLAVSVDSPFSHLKCSTINRSEGGLKDLNYPLLSDLKGHISEDYQLLGGEGFALPALFLIDKDGLLQYYTICLL